jgi:hypothetical protein
MQKPYLQQSMYNKETKICLQTKEKKEKKSFKKCLQTMGFKV